MKCKSACFDFGIQTLLIFGFGLALIFNLIPFYCGVLGLMLMLGAWQLLSTAIWGLFFADYSRGQYFIVAILILAGTSVLLNLPELRGSSFILLIGKFGALVWIASYYYKSFRDSKKSLEMVFFN